MALPDNDIRVSDIKTLLGYTPDNVAALCDNQYVNINSFYAPIDLEVSYSTKQIRRKTKTTDYRLGDFRRYDHAAIAPALYTTDFSLNYQQGDNEIQTAIVVRHEQMNLLAADPGISHVKVKLYADSSRNNYIGEGAFVPITWVDKTPPAGHGRSQSQGPTSSQVITPVIIPNPSWYPYVWFDVWLCASTGVELAHYSTWRGTIQLIELVPPIVNIDVVSGTYPPGYTGIFFTKTGHVISGQNITITGYLEGIPSAQYTPVRLSGQADFKEYLGGNLYNIELNQALHLDVDSNISGVLTGNYSYGSIIYVKVYIDFVN